MRVDFAQGRVRVAGPALLAALGLLVSACGNSTTGHPATAADAAKVLGTQNKATGSPVLLGLISDGKGTSVDQTGEIKGAQAAVGYANTYLGGINGHAIQLKVCSTQNVAAQATACANQMVAAKVSAVLAGTLAEADQSIAVLSAAKIPEFFSQASSRLALTAPHVFSMTNAVNYFSTPAAYAKQLGYKQATEVVIDVPGASGPAQQIGSLLFGKAGVGFNVMPIAPGTADMTPQIQAAQSKNPQMYSLLGDATFCTSAIKALRTLAVKATIVAAETCVNSAASASIPGGYQGVKVVSTLQFNPADQEYKIFKAALDHYGDGTRPASIPGIGYAVTLGLVRVLNAAKVKDTSPAGLGAAVKSAPPVPYPLNGGATFQCDGKAVPLSANICSSNGLLADAATDGTLSNYQVIKAGGLFAPGG
jgi:branched-chain amino acid transport system substrate-binding protein